MIRRHKVFLIVKLPLYKRELRRGVQIQSRKLACHEGVMPGAGYHGSVIRAVPEIRAAEAYALFFACPRQRTPESSVCGYASCKRKGIKAMFLCGVHRLEGKGIAYSPLEGGRNVRL